MQAHALVDKALVIARDGRSDFNQHEYGRKKVAVFATQSFFRCGLIAAQACLCRHQLQRQGCWCFCSTIRRCILFADRRQMP